jgi:hypothetical protein
VKSLLCVLKNTLRDLRGGRHYMSTLFVLYVPYFGLACLLSRHDNVALVLCIGFSSPFKSEADIILQFQISDVVLCKQSRQEVAHKLGMQPEKKKKIECVECVLCLLDSLRSLFSGMCSYTLKEDGKGSYGFHFSYMVQGIVVDFTNNENLTFPFHPMSCLSLKQPWRPIGV